MRKLTIILALFCSLIATAQRQAIDGVVWVVGENSILRSEVEEQALMAQYNGTTLDANANCLIAEQIAIQHLFLHQATLDSIVANEGQVSTRVNMQLNQYIAEIGSQEKLEEYFKKSLNEIREELFEVIKKQMIVQEVQQKIIGNNKTSPSEVRKFYENLKQDSIPTLPATVEVQVIRLDPHITESEKEAVKNRLRELAERVNKGNADFTMLARLYSEDEGTAKQGGELGFFGRGMMEPEFSNVAFDLQEPGKVSRVVETVYGYHIIQLVEKKGDRINCRHILMRPKISTDVKSSTLNRLDSIAFVIKNNNLTFEQAAAQFSTDKNTRLNGGLMSNPNTASARFEYQNLPSEIAREVYNMQKGEVSKPFAMIDSQLGKEVYVIVKVKDKLDAHKANLTDDYQVIKRYFEGIKSEEIIDNWVKNKIKETYIYISPELRDCKFKYSGWIK
ncbi:MAG: peptidylprolyl isomerase [Porphyromonadaceae bacterium]|nr:peptidylprolyl isomerase [Porphyromonadaceae bacterium]